MARQTTNGSAPAPIRVALVGLGYWGPNLLRNFSESAMFELAWACDMRQEALDPIARRYPGIACTTRYEDVLRDSDVDAVAIATPVSTHYALARSALEAGKHVFVEKPLAAASEEILELTRVADGKDLILMPGHTFVYSPPVTTIKRLIDSGELGEIYHFRGRYLQDWGDDPSLDTWRFQADEAGSGALGDLGEIELVAVARRDADLLAFEPLEELLPARGV
jgi:predicted dehydrogenase